jgi:hypothetical protein
MTTGQRWALAASMEQGEGDQVLGFLELEGHALQ